MPTCRSRPICSPRHCDPARRPSAAARVVGTALGGPLGRQLVRVADGLAARPRPDRRLGGDARDRRTRPGSPTRSCGSADSGAAVAGALERLADGLRVPARPRVESAAQRLGVLMVLPLGLCFLPAFVFAGIAPVIVAVLGGVLR